jgi:PAS domain S-box-containing protein
VWVATAPDGRFVYANRAFDEILGGAPKPDVISGQYAEKYGIFTRDGLPYPEESLPFVLALQQRDTVLVDDIVIHRPDGGRAFVRAVARPVFDDGGAMTHIAIAFTDITREVQAEETRSKAQAERAELLAREVEALTRAASAEEQLRNVIAHAPVLLWAFDTQGTVTLSQGRGLAILGWDPKLFLGRTIWELYPDNPQVIAACRRALTGEAFTNVVEVGTITFETSYTPLFGADGKVTSVIGVSIDVSERQRVQAQLIQTDRMVSMGTLAAGMAHEVNNPLAFVVANLYVMQEELARIKASSPSPVPDGFEEALRDARVGAERIRLIVRDLKTFSRADEASQTLVDIRHVIETSIHMVRHELRAHAQLVTQLSRVPKVLANEARLGQVFVNLLLNAVQAIPEGHSLTNEVGIATRADAQGRVLIEIRDTGVGVAPEARSRVFDPFFTTKPFGRGTGLGLSVCQNIITALGGAIDFESEVGKGTTFRVLLPAAPSEAVEAAASLVPPASRPNRRCLVLVIDDEPLVGRSIQLLLADHDVETTVSAREGLAYLLSGRRYDAVFCDLLMPDMTGMDLYAELKRLVPRAADELVFVTGGAFTAAGRDFLSQVSNRRIEKPFDKSALLAILGELEGSPLPNLSR